MNTKNSKVKYKGELDLMGFKLPCYVLEDGTRVLSSRGVQNVLKMTDEDDKQSSGIKLGQNLSQKSLEPFIDKAKTLGHFEPIICYDGNKEIHGYEATVLTDICNIYLKARRNIHLSSRQKIIAEQCEIIVSATAKVGIIALVDEATGYQYDREKLELQKILRLIVLREGLFARWQETFPLNFYKELFEVYDIPFTFENIKRKPRFIGWLTSELIYKNLPEGSYVLKEIKARTPKTRKGYYQKSFHRSLTPMGKEMLKERIAVVRTLAWVSGKDRNKFRRLAKERLKLDKELPYIDVEAMDNDKKKQSKELTKLDKAVETLTKVPKNKKEEDKDE